MDHSQVKCIVGYRIACSVDWLYASYFGKCSQSFGLSLHTENLHTRHSTHIIHCRLYAILNTTFPNCVCILYRDRAKIHKTLDIIESFNHRQINNLQSAYLQDGSVCV